MVNDYKKYSMSRFYYMDVPMLMEVVKIYFPSRLKQKREKEILSLKNQKKARRGLIKILKKGIGDNISLNSMVEKRFLENRVGRPKQTYYENELEYSMPYFKDKLPEFITL